MDLPKDLPKYAKMGISGLDKKKLMEISEEVMPVGVEFIKKLKDIARKYNKDYPAETSECLIATFLTSISASVGDEQTIGLLIEMLHKQHVFNAMKEAIPMEDAKKLIEKIDNDFRKHSGMGVGKDVSSSDEFGDFINEVVDKDTRKSDDRPDYLG